MMKSFFKKLAFVMAMAMVVSMAAPAAASAAEAGISLQGTKTIVTTESVEAGKTIDFSFQGAPSDWKKTYEWTSSDDAIASVDKAGLVTAHKGGVVAITITAGADKSYQHSVILTVTEPVVVPTMDAKQTTVDDVYVTFAESTAIPETGEGISIFRVFSAEEMASMGNDKGLVVNAEGEGYAQWYVVAADATDDTDDKEYTVTVYERFVDGATYAVVLGDNDQTWEIEGIEVRFVASVGVPTDLKVVQDNEAVAPTEIDEAVPAVIETIFLDKNGIDVSALYSQDDVEYEITHNEELGYLSSNNEITFTEAGKMLVTATFVYYNEVKEEDVEVVSKKPGEVVCVNPAEYTGATLYQWSLTNGSSVDWSKPVHSLPAGDEGYRLVVVLKDSRGNYLTNDAAGTKTKAAGTNKKPTLIDENNDDLAFVRYGFSVQFDTLDSNNLLVETDGEVYTYTETRSYAVAYLYKDEETKVGEMGVMPINVTAERAPKYFEVNTKSVSLLKESEAEYEDGVYISDYYHDDFCVGSVKLWFRDNYDTKVYKYDNNYTYDFVVTPTKNAKNETVLAICDNVEAYLNANSDSLGDGEIKIKFDSADFDNLSSVSFKITETNTKCSEVITVAINSPKYNTYNKDKADEYTTVFVDPAKGILATEESSGVVNAWSDDTTRIYLYQTSKTGQKVGIFRLGTLEENAFDGIEHGFTGANKQKVDLNHGYFVSNYAFKDVASNIYSLVSKTNAEDIVKGKLVVELFERTVDKDKKVAYVSLGDAKAYFDKLVADGASTTVAERALRKLYYMNVTRTTKYGEIIEPLQKDDFVLFLTAPSGNAVVATKSGIKLDADGDRVKFTISVKDSDGYTTFAEAGTYKANVYRVEEVNLTTGKVVYKSVANTSFKVTDPKQTVTYYHQTDSKSVDSLDDYEDIIAAIEETMTFKVNGAEIDWGDDIDGIGYWTDEADIADKDEDEYDYKVVIAEYLHELDKDGNLVPGVTYIEKNGCVTINTVTLRIYTRTGGFYETTVKVGKSIYVAQ